MTRDQPISRAFSPLRCPSIGTLLVNGADEYPFPRRPMCVKRNVTKRRQTRRWRRCQTAAFTLVEVLVVISIIGLLLAILIPSMARAREKARSVICRSNLTEWGRMMMMYTDENSGYLPYEDRGEEHLGRVCWFDALDWSYSTTEAPESVKACPTVLRNDPEREESYRMNSKLAEANQASEYYQPYRKLGRLRRPAQTVLLFDGDVGGDQVSFKGRWRLRNDDVNYRHNRATNFLFADWHVENLRQQEVGDKSLENTLLIWQPEDMWPWDPKP
jgi:prepilin-type processing-associated H-X9-DG protein/prepilin-type N-terminal cleavage/methylation domain-containing protein